MKQNPLHAIYDRCNAGNSWQKFKDLPEMPYLIDIEMTNTCNFRCLMCPTGNFSQRRSKGFMTKDVLKKVLDDLDGYPIPIRFIRWGEPLTHPNIIEFMKAAKARGHTLHLNTNGSKLDDEMMEQLLAIPLDSIKFSFQGVDQKSYSEMRNIDFFEELVETIKRLREFRGDRPKPYIQASTTITYESKEMVHAFRKTFEGIVDEVNVGRTTLEFIDLDTVRLRPDEMKMLRYLKEQESVVRKHPECPEVYDKLSINWDGTVTACCTDSENKMLIGDLRDSSISDIWKSDTLNKYREMLADMRHDDLPLCKTCYDTHGLDTPGLQETD